jgi:hypothetical protein
VEYLLWRLHGFQIPPLVTTGTSTGLGALGQPGTSILLGNSTVNGGESSGARVTAGAWLTQYHDLGVEGSIFVLGERSQGFSASSNGSPLLARPFFDVFFGLPNSFVVAGPSIASGSIATSAATRLWGAELSLVANLFCWNLAMNGAGRAGEPPWNNGDVPRDRYFRTDLILGYRYLDLRETLGIFTDSVLAPGVAFFGGDTIDVTDRFTTRNQFNGGNIALRSEWHRGRFFVNGTAKIGLGSTEQVIEIHGATQIAGQNSLSAPVGLLALPTNIGRHTRETFSAVPEFNLNVGYQIGDCVRIFAGYNYLYWSHVVRPGDQIDLSINSTQLPTSLVGALIGVARPVVPFRETNFWAQGFNVGFEVRF